MIYFRFMIAICIVVSNKYSFAQQDSIQTLSEITVAENRIKVPFNKVSQNVQMISKKDIESKAAHSLQEVLSFAPGLDVRQRGPGGVQADIGIRGGSFEQTLMLLNGIKLTDPQTGHHIMNIPVPLFAADRIDILKGPGARIFGQNAFAGAINVITRVPDSTSLRLRGYAGDFGSLGAAVYAALPVGKLRQSVSASHDQSSGYWYNSDYKVNQVFYENEVKINGKNGIRGMFGYSNREFGANGYYSNRFPDQWEATSTFIAALSHDYRSAHLNLQSRAYWRQNDDEFRLKRKDPAFYTNTHQSQVKALELNATYKWSAGVTGAGAEAREESINSSNLGNRSRRLLGLFLEHRVEFAKQFDLRGGVYANYYDEYGWKYFPGAELGWQFTSRSRLYTNVGRSFRIPSYTELYYQDPSNSSNPLLKPEDAFSYELGYRYHRKNVRAEAAVFRRISDNMIDYFREESDSSVNTNKWTPMNLANVSFTGFEFSVVHSFIQSGKVTLNQVSLSYNYLHSDFSKPAGVESRYALSALRHQLIGGMQLSLFKKVELNVNARYISRISYSPYFLLDAKINYNWKKNFSIFAEATNITDIDYIEAGFVQMPGRWFRSGFSLQLK